MNQFAFAVRVYNLPTPRHASQDAETIRNNFLDLLTADPRHMRAIRDAAAGRCMLVMVPSRTQNANAVFGAVIQAMLNTFKTAKQHAAATEEPVAAEQPYTQELDSGTSDAANQMMEAAFA
jgi:hypothetical protein